MKKKIQIDIDTEYLMKKIKRSLGYPMIMLEINDDMIYNAIFDSIDISSGEIGELIYKKSLNQVKESLYNVRDKFKNIDLICGSTINPEGLKYEE